MTTRLRRSRSVVVAVSPNDFAAAGKLLRGADGSEEIQQLEDLQARRVDRIVIHASDPGKNLPLFALHTKGLRTLDGIECRGKLTRDGVGHEFIYRATRNNSTSIMTMIKAMIMTMIIMTINLGTTGRRSRRTTR